MTNCLPAIYVMAGHSAAWPSNQTWHAVRWSRAVRLVKSLQSRIVKAVRAGRWNKVKVLQGILSRSYAARLVAVRRVTENSGQRTAGIDGQKWDSPAAKLAAVGQLKRKGYRAQAVRRITIPKGNGQRRALGIPTMKDRAMQAVYLLGLDPVAETLADENSYGFRAQRSCADAIARCFSLLAKPASPQWILEGDIKGCFDHISHDWLLERIPMDKAVLAQWLRAGYVSKQQLYPTTAGTPQGAVISPTLANLVLDGLEMAIDEAAGVKHYGRQAPKRRINPQHVHLVRYADDFVVTSSDRRLLTEVIRPAIKAFLAERGLELSAEKTQLTHIDDGFDFLGQNIRKYGGKLLITPARKNVQTFLAKVKQKIAAYRGSAAIDLLRQLSPMIRGWAMYHRHVVSKATFRDVDRQIWYWLWKWSKRRHLHHKSSAWIKAKYFTRHQGQDWTFFALSQEGYQETIFKAASVVIVRHPKIRASANPYAAEDELYFEQRISQRMLGKLDGKHVLRYLYEAQSGKCLVCQQPITSQTGWHAHHLHPKHLGGKWQVRNLVLLHPVCHVQVHHHAAAAQALHCCADQKR